MTNNQVQQVDREVALLAYTLVLESSGEYTDYDEGDAFISGEQDNSFEVQAARIMRECMEAERIAPLEAENKRLRDALWFYAREASWRTTTKYMSGRSGQTSVEIDSGSRARQALATMTSERIAPLEDEIARLRDALEEAYAALLTDSTRDGPRCLLLAKMQQALAGDTK